MVATFFTIFVSWKEGPLIWTEVAPYIYFCGAAFTYVIVPIFFCPWVILAWLRSDVENYQSIYFSWNICYAAI